MLPLASLFGLSCLLAIAALALAPNSRFALALLSPLFARITQKITRTIQVSTTTAQVDTLISISTGMLLRACCCARFPAYGFKKEAIALDNNAILTLTW